MLGVAHSDDTVSCYEQHAWSSFIPGMEKVGHGEMQAISLVASFRRLPGKNRLLHNVSVTRISHLPQVFREHVGVTPGDYRRNQ